MKIELIKISQLSGSKATIYGVRILGQPFTLFEQFLADFENSFISETKNLIMRLHSIGNKVGAQEHYFRLNEGKPGDGVCALPFIKGNILRLYSIRFGNGIVILGGGGLKPKGMRTLQESERLKEANALMREVSIKITEKVKSGEISFNKKGTEFYRLSEIELFV